jgi:hypothetical protein
MPQMYRLDPLQSTQNRQLASYVLRFMYYKIANSYTIYIDLPLDI